MLKRKAVIVVFLALIATIIATPSDAQFWKRKKHRKHEQHAQTSATDSTATAVPVELEHKSKKEIKKEQKRNRKEEARKKKRAAKEAKREAKANRKSGHVTKVAASVNNVSVPTGPVNKWLEIPYPPTVKKKGYRIDVLAPIYLDELVRSGDITFKENIPEKAVAGLNFYMGVQLAADSLKNAGFNMDIYIHDIASAAENPEKLIRNKVMDSTDLIIGAVTSHDIPFLAEYAKSKNVNFISVTSPVDAGIKDNPFYTMLQPSLKTHCEWLTDEIVKKAVGKKPVMIYRKTSVAEENALKYLSDNSNDLYRARFDVNILPDRDQMALMIDTNSENDIVMSILDNKYADSVIRILGRDFPNVRFNIYGMPNWSAALLKRTHQYTNIAIYQTVPFSTNLDMSATWYVADNYKKEYGGKPNDMVYRGFETMIWYANLLTRYGTVFNKHYDDNETAPFTKYEIKPQWDAAGNVLYLENRHIVLRKYDGKGLNH